MIEDKKTAEVYSSDEDTETAQEKRLRLAKDYLAQLEEEGYCAIIICYYHPKITSLKYVS